MITIVVRDAKALPLALDSTGAGKSWLMHPLGIRDFGNFLLIQMCVCGHTISNDVSWQNFNSLTVPFINCKHADHSNMVYFNEDPISLYKAVEKKKRCLDLRSELGVNVLTEQSSDELNKIWTELFENEAEAKQKSNRLNADMRKHILKRIDSLAKTLSLEDKVSDKKALEQILTFMTIKVFDNWLNSIGSGELKPLSVDEETGFSIDDLYNLNDQCLDFLNSVSNQQDFPEALSEFIARTDFDNLKPLANMKSTPNENTRILSKLDSSTGIIPFFLQGLLTNENCPLPIKEETYNELKKSGCYFGIDPSQSGAHAFINAATHHIMESRYESSLPTSRNCSFWTFGFESASDGLEGQQFFNTFIFKVRQIDIANYFPNYRALQGAIPEDGWYILDEVWQHVSSNYLGSGCIGNVILESITQLTTTYQSVIHRSNGSDNEMIREKYDKLLSKILNNPDYSMINWQFYMNDDWNDILPMIEDGSFAADYKTFIKVVINAPTFFIALAKWYNSTNAILDNFFLQSNPIDSGNNSIELSDNMEMKLREVANECTQLFFDCSNFLTMNNLIDFAAINAPTEVPIITGCNIYGKIISKRFEPVQVLMHSTSQLYIENLNALANIGSANDQLMTGGFSRAYYNTWDATNAGSVTGALTSMDEKTSRIMAAWMVGSAAGEVGYVYKSNTLGEVQNKIEFRSVATHRFSGRCIGYKMWDYCIHNGEVYYFNFSLPSIHTPRLVYIYKAKYDTSQDDFSHELLLADRLDFIGYAKVSELFNDSITTKNAKTGEYNYSALYVKPLAYENWKVSMKDFIEAFLKGEIGVKF